MLGIAANAIQSYFLKPITKSYRLQFLCSWPVLDSLWRSLHCHQSNKPGFDHAMHTP